MLNFFFFFFRAGLVSRGRSFLHTPVGTVIGIVVFVHLALPSCGPSKLCHDCGSFVVVQ